MADDRAEQAAQTFTEVRNGTLYDLGDHEVIGEQADQDLSATDHVAADPFSTWLSGPPQDDDVVAWYAASGYGYTPTSAQYTSPWYGLTAEPYYLGQRTTQPVADSGLDIHLTVPGDFEETQLFGETHNYEETQPLDLTTAFTADPESHNVFLAPTNKTPVPELVCPFPDCTSSAYSRKADLQRHVSSVHTPPSPCPLKHCGYKYNRLDKLRDHIRARHEGDVEMLFVCKTGDCNYGPGVLSTIQAHALAEHPDAHNSKIHKVQISSLNGLLDYLSTLGRAELAGLRTEQQGASLRSASNKSSIPEDWSSVISSTYDVDVVGSSSGATGQSHPPSHRRQALDDLQPLLSTKSCSICRKTFTRRSELRHHHIHEHSQPRLACTDCNKRFFWPKDLRRHQQSHTDTKSYTCEKCNQTFRRSDNLARHMRVKHAQLSESHQMDL